MIVFYDNCIVYPFSEPKYLRSQMARAHGAFISRRLILSLKGWSAVVFWCISGSLFQGNLFISLAFQCIRWIGFIWGNCFLLILKSTFKKPFYKNKLLPKNRFHKKIWRQMKGNSNNVTGSFICCYVVSKVQNRYNWFPK